MLSETLDREISLPSCGARLVSASHNPGLLSEDGDRGGISRCARVSGMSPYTQKVNLVSSLCNLIKGGSVSYKISLQLPDIIICHLHYTSLAVRLGHKFIVDISIRFDLRSDLR